MRDIQEEWKDVPGYKGYYQVSNFGRVKSLERKITTSNGKRMTRKEKILNLSYDGRGYMQVRFYINGHFPCYKVHRLVARAFLKGYESEKEVNHINGNKLDNRADNLEWISHNENMVHRATVINRKPRGISKRDSDWHINLSINGKRWHTYRKTKEEAYKAFYDKFLEIHGVEPWDLNEYPTHKKEEKKNVRTS